MLFKKLQNKFLLLSVKANKRNIIISFFVSVFLLIIGYYSNNLSLFTGEKLGLLATLETANRICGFKDEEISDSVIYINTSFDKVLIPYYQRNVVTGEKLPIKIGNTEITDRGKIVELLQLLENVNYKYLIIDICFEKGLESDLCVTDSITGSTEKIDDKLTSLINSLDRVIIPTHDGIRLINIDLEKKAALADYKSTATTTNFIRYKYFDSIPYIPLAVYNDLKKREGLDTIQCHYPFGLKKLKDFAVYTQGHRLCHNSLFLDFKIKDNNPLLDGNGYFNATVDYRNLSQHILDQEDPESVVKNFENKYIIVCDYLQDLHDTYAGKQPGGVIFYNAIKSLNNNKHIVSLRDIIILFLLYFSISLFILNGKNICNLIKRSDNPLLIFIIDTASFTLILSIYQIIEYMHGRTSFSFVIPIIFFSIMKAYMLLKEKYKMKRNLFVFLLSLIMGLLMSFTVTKNENKASFKVVNYNSNLIYVDGKEIALGMTLTPNSQIDFKYTGPHNLFVELLNVGDDYVIEYGNGNVRKDVWKKGDYRVVYSKKERKKADLFWWILKNRTSTKGGGLFGDVEYVIGEERTFRIEDTIKIPAKQYYQFDVIGGENNGKKFLALPDSTDPAIWISRDLLKKHGISLNPNIECDSLNVNVIYHCYGETDTLKKSMIIKFIKTDKE